MTSGQRNYEDTWAIDDPAGAIYTFLTSAVKAGLIADVSGSSMDTPYDLDKDGSADIIDVYDAGENLTVYKRASSCSIKEKMTISLPDAVKKQNRNAYEPFYSSITFVMYVPLDGAAVSAVKDCTYTGSNIEPKVDVMLNGTALKEGTDYALSYANNKKAGQASLIVTGIGNTMERSRRRSIF